MTDKPNQPIPDEMRDLTERSVEQARAAFDGFIEALRRKADTTGEAAAVATSGIRDVSSRGFEFAGRNVDAAFDLAKKLVRAKDAREILELQAEFVRVQYGAMQEQAKELGATAKAAMERPSK